MAEISLTLPNEQATEKLGRKLAECLPTQCVVALDGTLGAGKTRLVRAFAEACGVPVNTITSPTFTLWQTYEGSRTIHHLDAYRISDEDEFADLGIEEAYEESAVIFIEWAARVHLSLPKDHISIYLDVVTDSERQARISSDSARYDAALTQLSER